MKCFLEESEEEAWQTRINAESARKSVSGRDHQRKARVDATEDRFDKRVTTKLGRADHEKFVRRSAKVMDRAAEDGSMGVPTLPEQSLVKTKALVHVNVMMSQLKQRPPMICSFSLLKSATNENSDCGKPDTHLFHCQTVLVGLSALFSSTVPRYLVLRAHSGISAPVVTRQVFVSS